MTRSPKWPIVLALLVRAPEAYAAVDLCVEVNTSVEDAEGFEKLVISEVALHTSHRIVDHECASTLVVELFDVEGVRYLTARIGLAVPVRYEIESKDDLSHRLREGLSLVLGNDPVFLMEDISHLNAFQRATHSVLEKGQNTFRFELFQTIGRSDLGPAFAPGGAFSATRGADHWVVHARLYFGGWPGDLARENRALRIYAGADAGITFEASALSSATFYVGLGFGLQFLRFEGYVTLEGEEMKDYVNEFGVTASCRIGLRFLRIYDFDFDIFAAGYLPLFSTRQTDAVLFGEKGVYTPTVQAGVGVGF
jgi:hypothetical protein